MANEEQVTLTVEKGAREEWLAAREETLSACRTFLSLPEADRNPDAAANLIEAMVCYLEGEEKAGL